VVGFNVYRAASAAGPYTRLNAALIPARGDWMTGAVYRYVDTPGFGAFTYQLEDVGRRPASRGMRRSAWQIEAPQRLYLPLLTR